MAAEGDFSEDLLQRLLEKMSYMEKRGNFQGHDGDKVLKRELVEEIARCSAVKLQKSHFFKVKITMLKLVLENEEILEFAKKTLKLTREDFTAALDRMKLLHKLELTNTHRIGMEKPGDLCKGLQACSWVNTNANTNTSTTTNTNDYYYYHHYYYYYYYYYLPTYY